MNQRGYVHIVLPVTILLISAVLVGVSVYYKANRDTSQTATPVVSQQANTSISTNSSVQTNTTVELVPEWQMYTSDTFGYTVQYPATWGLEVLHSQTGEPDPNGYFVNLWNTSTYDQHVLDNFLEPFGYRSWLGDAYFVSIVAGGPTRDDFLARSGISLLSSEPYVVSDTTGTKDRVQGPADEYTLVFVEKNGNTIMFILPDDSEEQRASTKEILDTFQFTNPDPTAGWVTYTDPNCEFTIQHPADWFAGDPDGNTGCVQVYPPDAFTPDRQTATPSLHFSVATVADIDEENLLDVRRFTTSGGVQAVQGTKEGIPHLQVTGFTNTGGQSYIGVSRPLVVQYSDIFDHILDTFQFTDADPTAGWETYTNEEQGYTIQHPPTWSVNQIDDHGGYVSIRSPEKLDETSIAPGASLYLVNIFPWTPGTQIHGLENVSTVTVNGVQGTRARKPGIPHETNVFLELGTQGALITWPETSTTDTIEQILSTFQFTDADPTAGWETYSIDEYTFEYPRKWTPGSSSTNPIGQTVVIFSDSAGDVAELRCPISETGYETTTITEQSVRSYEKDGRTHGARWWAGRTSNSSSVNQGIAYMFRNDFANWYAEGDYDHSCQLWLLRVDDESLQALEHVYTTVK